jgi:hypothetical protein
LKKLQITLLIVLSSIFFTNGAMAQNKPLACQQDVNVGVEWERGRWGSRDFILRKYVLVQAGRTLTLESVARAMQPDQPTPDQINCNTTLLGHITCADMTGNNLFFDPKTLKGGISKLFGTTNAADIRDTVSVSAFSCTPF